MKYAVGDTIANNIKTGVIKRAEATPDKYFSGEYDILWDNGELATDHSWGYIEHTYSLKEAAPYQPKPKLKVGDTFVYTKEMNEAKKASKYPMSFSECIGRTMTVVGLNKKGCYTLDTGSNRCLFSVIDDHLPVTEDLPTMVTGEVKAFTPAPPAYAPGDIYSGWEDLKPFPEYIKWKKLKEQFNLTDESLLVIVKSDGGLSSANGTIIKLNKDDGSDCPFFTDGTEANLCGYSQWLAPLPGKRKGMVNIEGDEAIEEKIERFKDMYTTTYTNDVGDGEPLTADNFNKARQMAAINALAQSHSSLLNTDLLINSLTPHTMSDDTSAVQKLSAWAKRTFSPDQKALFKAGFIDGNGAPTNKGRQELDAILFEANLAELVKTAKAENKCDKA